MARCPLSLQIFFEERWDDILAANPALFAHGLADRKALLSAASIYWCAGWHRGREKHLVQVADPALLVNVTGGFSDPLPPALLPTSRPAGGSS